MADSCATCKFYDNHTADMIADNTCHRYAPKPVPTFATEAKLYDAVWPRVKADDWCGEWAAVPAPA